MIEPTRRQFLAGCLASLGLVLTRPLVALGRFPSGREASIVWEGSDGARVQWWAEWRIDGVMVEGAHVLTRPDRVEHTVIRGPDGVELVMGDGRRLEVKPNPTMGTSFGTMEVLELPVDPVTRVVAK